MQTQLTIESYKNKIILGDCLEVLRKMDSESIDLIYLDPPFFSNRNYEVIWGDEGEMRSFNDRWAGGINHYTDWLYDRVYEMHRLLKPTGSIYLHCDWHADAYIRVLVLDKIFGYKNFRGDIVWKRANAHNDAKKKLAVLSDTIWYYSKSDNFVYNPTYVELNEKYVEKTYNKQDSRGKYRCDNITGAHINSNDQEWKGYHPNSIGRSWSVPKEIVKRLVGEEKAKQLSTIEKLDLLDINGYIQFSKNGVPSFKRYLETSQEKGQLIGNWWGDIGGVQGSSRERIGYPTQKPLALLDRIIKASSNAGDTVLDPFMGGGTSVVMASRLGRQFIGIDQSIAALDVTDKRLQAEGLYSNYEIEKHYYALEDLQDMPPFKFERWIVEKFGGTPNTKQVADGGSDGVFPAQCGKDMIAHPAGAPIQVKQWKQKVGRPEIQKFQSVCRAGRKFRQLQELGQPVGYFIAFEFSKEAMEEISRLKNDDGIIIKSVLVKEVVPLERRPSVNISWRRLEDGRYEFEAKSDSNIINYSWDFAYPLPAYKHSGEEENFKPTVLFDKKGVQTLNFASSGTHNIAVKVVDDKYLENVAVCTVSL